MANKGYNGYGASLERRSWRADILAWMGAPFYLVPNFVH